MQMVKSHELLSFLCLLFGRFNCGPQMHADGETEYTARHNGNSRTKPGEAHTGNPCRASWLEKLRKRYKLQTSPQEQLRAVLRI